MSSFLLYVPSIPLFVYALYNIIRGSQYNKEDENTYNSATTTRVIQIRTYDMGGTYSLHGVMRKGYINIGIGKQEIRRTLRDLVAVRKTSKNVCFLNPLTPNDPYRGRTAPLTSKVAFYIFIQLI